MQARGFRLYFTPLLGVLPTFPSRYWFAIGLRQYSALRDGPRGFGQDSTCPALLRCPELLTTRCPYGGVTLCAGVFQTPSGSCGRSNVKALQPRRVLERDGLGSSLFARRYWGNRLFLSSPPGTNMFQFPGFALPQGE